ncbi:glycosyltransferase family 4 protein [Phaeodactylibacter xiamenensis]|uniref:glycosyltransferase family 4 protein n=2 Tax=Phaeodactylibacter xiamenensis TaxID=1524460 RepID=UPI00069777F1|nr:MraY family glycosyltransferase [Phaeodactylibacter xiamenensis]
MENIISGFVTSFAFTYLAIPPVIKIANERHLCDVPGERSSHFVATPSLGGVGIFMGILIALFMWVPFASHQFLQYLVGALFIIFVVGLKDDLEPMDAKKKLVAQMITAFLIVYACDIRIESMHGLLGFHSDFPYWFSLLVSGFTVLVIMNAFNLIDGINGLSASIGILVSTILGIWFFNTEQPAFAILAAITTAAYLAFLRYNIMPPTRTFMGDTGSLILGTITATLVIQFITSNAALNIGHMFHLQSIAAVSMTVVVVPLFDTLRVFATRMARGHSPLMPDRRHIHHLLVDYGFTHAQATGVLVAFNAGMILFAFIGQNYLEQHLILGIVLLSASLGTLYFHRAVNRKREDKKKILQLNSYRSGRLSTRREEEKAAARSKAY